MPAWTTYSETGRVHAGEKDRLYVPYGYRYDGTRRAIIYCHGSSGDYRTGPVEKTAADQLGCVWICTDLGGGDTWGSDASLDRVTECWAYAKANLGVKTDKLLLWSGSMGGDTALLYTLAHAANVAAMGAAIPVVDPEYVRQNDVGGRKALIEAVYGVGVAVPDAKQPSLQAASWPSVPCKLWYSTTDPYTPLASTLAFVSASGVQSASMGAIGHSFEAQLDATEVVAFLRSYVA